MIFVLLILLILTCVYKKQYRNYKILNISITIWAFVTVTILILRPDINNAKTYSIEEKLSPMENDLDSTEQFYLIVDEGLIYYKTNKIRTIVPNDSIFINYNDSIQPKIIRYYKKNSTLWYLLTFNKKSSLTKIEFYTK